MNRRSFITSSIGAAVAAILPASVVAKARSELRPLTPGSVLSPERLAKLREIHEIFLDTRMEYAPFLRRWFGDENVVDPMVIELFCSIDYMESYAIAARLGKEHKPQYADGFSIEDETVWRRLYIEGIWK